MGIFEYKFYRKTQTCEKAYYGYRMEFSNRTASCYFFGVVDYGGVHFCRKAVKILSVVRPHLGKIFSLIITELGYVVFCGNLRFSLCGHYIVPCLPGIIFRFSLFVISTFIVYLICILFYNESITAKYQGASTGRAGWTNWCNKVGKLVAVA